MLTEKLETAEISQILFSLEAEMNAPRKNVKKLDALIDELRKHFPKSGVQILETNETWSGKGWGFRIERHRTQTTARILNENTNEGD